MSRLIDALKGIYEEADFSEVIAISRKNFADLSTEAPSLLGIRVIAADIPDTQIILQHVSKNAVVIDKIINIAEPKKTND